MKKYWIVLVSIFMLGLFYIFIDKISVNHILYVEYKRDNSFYFDHNDGVYYFKKNGKIWQFREDDNKISAFLGLEKIKNLNMISIDSLSEILPSNFYKPIFFENNNKRNHKIYFVDIDSINNIVNFKSVYQIFIEYD